MFSISCDEMKAMDSYTIREIGIPSIVLMERASLEFVKNIDLEKNDSFTIVVGTGNNGGDGLAIARHLLLNNKKVDIFILGNINKGSIDFNINLDIIKNLNKSYLNVNTTTDLNILKDSILKNDIVIDGIFGIGLTRNLEDIHYDAIEIINNNSKSTIAIDIPSGIHGDTGDILGISTVCEKTITFHRLKHGLDGNEKYTGDVVVADIGIPKVAEDHVLVIYRN